MVIMSDMANFCLKLACAILGMFAIGFMVAYVHLYSKGPEVAYRVPNVIWPTDTVSIQVDTVVVHDTVYRWIAPKTVEVEEEMTSEEDSAQ